MSTLPFAFALNILFNSAVSFFLLYGLLTLVRSVLRSRCPRLQVYLTALPALKLWLDPLLRPWSQWALAHGVNPSLAEEGSRTLSSSAHSFGFLSINLTLPVEGQRLFFSFADLFYLQYTTLTVCLVSLCVLVSAIKLVSLRFTQEALNVPHVRGWLFPRVYIPGSLRQRVSTDTFRAIERHETRHAQWRDPLLLGVLEITARLFWYLPLDRIIRRVKLLQEIDCDRYAVKEGNALDYAQTLISISREQKAARWTPTATHALQQRVQLIVHPIAQIRLLWSILALAGFWILFWARFAI